MGNPVDTSHGNRYLNNLMGVGPGGREDLNGNDFWWDGQGRRNCWEGNRGFRGSKPTDNVRGDLPECPGSPVILPGNGQLASQAACAAWDPSDERTDSSLPGCDWFKNPSEPRSRTGTTGNDELGGTQYDDTIYCGSGHDRVDGGAGNDVIYCGSGNDVVRGGEGNDRLYGQSGDDELIGGPGEDRLSGGSGHDTKRQ